MSALDWIVTSSVLSAWSFYTWCRGRRKVRDEIAGDVWRVVYAVVLRMNPESQQDFFKAVHEVCGESRTP